MYWYFVLILTVYLITEYLGGSFGYYWYMKEKGHILNTKKDMFLIPVIFILPIKLIFLLLIGIKLLWLWLVKTYKKLPSSIEYKLEETEKKINDIRI